MKKLMALMIVALSLFVLNNSNAFSGVWIVNSIPGTYGGTQPDGTIICHAPFDVVCFRTYTPLSGPSQGVAQALFVPAASWGLVGINGVNQTPLGHTPVTTEKTEEVNNESEVIEWMNDNFGE